MKTEKTRLMIVDDDVGLTLLMKMNLELEGNFEIEVENHSPSATGTAHRFQPDLIVLDYKMPEMNGGEVLACLEADPDLQAVPVIMVSASLSPDGFDRDGIPLWEGHPVLPKPVDLSQLTSTAETILTREKFDHQKIAV